MRSRRLLTVAVAWAGAVAAAGFVACPSSRATESLTVPTTPDGDVALTIDGWAGLSGPIDGRDDGLLPIAITIENRSAATRAWNVAPVLSVARPSAAVPTARIVVPGRATVKTTLHLDSVAPGGGMVAYLRIDGPGIESGEHAFAITNPVAVTAVVGGTAVDPLPCAVSNGVAAVVAGGFEGYSTRGGSLDMAAPPEDWRGWTPFPALLCTEAEWLELAPAARRALHERVALGGRVGVLVADASAARLDGIRLPAADADGRRRIGAGEIVPVAWDGRKLDKAALDRFVAGRQAGEQGRRFLAYGGSRRFTGRMGTVVGGVDDTAPGWDGAFARLAGAFGPRSLPVVPILWFLGALAIVAGPVNLLLFAGPGRRSRLFWTTPAISLAATALLLALMFLRDGVGGRGVRRVLALLVPADNALAVVQEQFSRTGVLLSGGFPGGEPSWMRPVGDVEVDAGFHEADDRWRSGDWFRSRSDQAFVVQAVRPSRARIEFVGGKTGPPEVISSIEVPLDRLFVIDEEGRSWTARDVGTGERRTLEPATADDYRVWFDGIAADAGPIRRAALDAVRNVRGHVYADTTAAAAVAIKTLPSVRWQDERAVFVGPYERTPTP